MIRFNSLLYDFIGWASRLGELCGIFATRYKHGHSLMLYFPKVSYRASCNTDTNRKAELLEVITKEELNRYTQNLISIHRNHMAVRAYNVPAYKKFFHLEPRVIDVTA